MVAIWTGEEVSIRGSATGFDRIYYSTDAQCTVVSDRADTLAEHVGAQIDHTGLAISLISPVSHPFDQGPLWTGIVPVQPGLMLSIRAGTPPAVIPWWDPPDAHASLSDGAKGVRSAIQESVRDAGAGHDAILADLSGGLDSTTITALGLDLFPRTHFVALTAGDLGQNRDQMWAEQAARHLRPGEHIMLGGADLPLVYSDTLDLGAETDHPSPALATRSTIRSIAAIGRTAGATTHLTGHGGDHMFYGMPTLLRDSVWRRPRGSLRKINAYRHMLGWPLHEIIRQLLCRQTYAECIKDYDRQSPVRKDRIPILRWTTPPTLPPWISNHGRDLIAEYVVSPTTDLSPMSRRPGAHAELDTIRQGAQLARAISQISFAHGLELQAPFFDDRVLTATLTLDAEARVDPWSYKAPLKLAMVDILPHATLTRTSKDEGSLELELGIRENRSDIRDLLEDSHLANLGIIDADILHHALETEMHPALSDSGLTTTICTESWLRGRILTTGMDQP
ncbi:asparagine synthase (glutamine-hydrolyzing) [Sanguibacter keddieii DSM 10542]|uniref:asparagine synthase (glutamine-hydrolyzing) n=1 Tax=Sanguibacter keddieii (strain ATCC 51767 / DSM 10542 / NCFB 3025 / ST-74) TaxID=446469 RepID=D1BF92_SANKS|nr:asparagine synthase (glutamine-hydrolyzing) [Sanguibacter keddieii DSM 10542]